MGSAESSSRQTTSEETEREEKDRRDVARQVAYSSLLPTMAEEDVGDDKDVYDAKTQRTIVLATGLLVGTAYYMYVHSRSAIDRRAHSSGSERAHSSESERAHSSGSERALPAPVVARQELKYRSAGAYENALVATLSRNGVPYTFRHLLRDFLHKLEPTTPATGCSLHVLVARCALLYAAAPIDVLHRLCCAAQEATERMQNNMSEYRRTYKAWRYERYAQMQRAHRSLAEFNDGQLVRLHYQIPMGGSARFCMLLPCSLRVPSSFDRVNANGRVIPADSTFEAPELFPTDVAADDAYYEQWASVYRYAPDTLAPRTSSPVGEKAAPRKEIDADEKTPSPEQDVPASNASSKKRKNVRNARRKRHEARMDRIHRDRVRRSAETLAAAQRNIAPKSANMHHVLETICTEAETCWTVLYEYVLCPTRVDVGLAIQKASLAAFGALRECAGMRPGYVSGAIECLEMQWRDIVPHLLQQPGRLQFQYNSSALQPSSELLGDFRSSTSSSSPSSTPMSKRPPCSRWVFVKSAETQTAIVDLDVARVVSDSGDLQTQEQVVNVRRERRIGAVPEPFLWPTLQSHNALAGCYAQTVTTYRQFAQLVTSHLPVSDLVALVLRDYGGIVTVDDADAQLAPTFEQY